MTSSQLPAPASRAARLVTLAGGPPGIVSAGVTLAATIIAIGVSTTPATAWDNVKSWFPSMLFDFLLWVGAHPVGFFGTLAITSWAWSWFWIKRANDARLVAEHAASVAQATADTRQHRHLADAVAIGQDTIGLDEDGTIRLATKLFNNSAYEAVTIRLGTPVLELIEISSVLLVGATPAPPIRVLPTPVGAPQITIQPGRDLAVSAEGRATFKPCVPARLFVVSGTWEFAIVDRDGTTQPRLLQIFPQQRVIRPLDPTSFSQPMQRS